jgi:1,4-alpha-glucan branching enzyme
VANFSAMPHGDYRLGLTSPGQWDEVVNTDAAAYSGSGVGNLGSIEAVEGNHDGQPAHATLVLPPLATVWFRKRPSAG